MWWSRGRSEATRKPPLTQMSIVILCNFVRPELEPLETNLEYFAIYQRFLLLARRKTLQKVALSEASTFYWSLQQSSYRLLGHVFDGWNWTWRWVYRWGWVCFGVGCLICVVRFGQKTWAWVCGCGVCHLPPSIKTICSWFLWYLARRRCISHIIDNLCLWRNESR